MVAKAALPCGDHESASTRTGQERTDRPACDARGCGPRVGGRRPYRSRSEGPSTSSRGEIVDANDMDLSTAKEQNKS